MIQLDIKSKIQSYFSKLAIAYAVVFAFQFFLLYPLHKSMDLPLWDESYCIGWGRDFALGISKLGALECSPGYVLLYSLFYRLFGTIASIFFMKYFLTISTTLLIFTFLIKNLRLLSIAILSSFLWAMSNYNIRANNMVYYFAVIIFILALVYSDKSRLISLLLLLLCVFIRLEYIFIFIPYFIYLAILFFRKKRQIKTLLAYNQKSMLTLSLLILLILLILLTYIAVNITDWNIGTRRIWFGFKQHYALTQQEAGRFNFNPWLDYNIIINQDFPNAHSVRDAFLINPFKFIYNILKNFVYLFKALLGFIFPSFFCDLWHIFLAIPILVFISATYIFLLKWQIFIFHVKSIISKLGDVYILSLIAPLALIPSLMVYTKTSYSLMLLPIIFLCAGVLYRAFLEACDHSVYIEITLHVLICLILLVVIGSPMPFGQKNIQRSIYEKVLKLKQIWPSGKIKLLGVGSSSYAIYLGHEMCLPIEPLANVREEIIKKISLKEMLASFKPDVILINQELSSFCNFDKNSLEVLDSKARATYVIGDEKIYFLRHE